jgi:hypothetical protein
MWIRYAIAATTCVSFGAQPALHSGMTKSGIA